MNWTTILGVLLIGFGALIALVIVVAVIAAGVKTVRRGDPCERCGHVRGDPIDGPPILRTRRDLP